MNYPVWYLPQTGGGLLIAIIAAIALTLHHIKGTKHQNPAKQVQVKKADRLKVIQMEAEAKESPSGPSTREDV